MIIPDGFALVAHTFVSSFAPRNAVITYGIAVNDLATPQEHADELANELVPVVPQMCHGAADMVLTQVRFGPTPDGPVAESSGSIAGGGVGSPMTPQVAELVHKFTALGGRKHRGRMFWPFCDEANIDGGGNVVSGAHGDQQAALSLWRTSLFDAGMPMVVLHNDATVPTPVTSLVLSTLVGTQRRRLRG